jgi:hypothetical protein
LGTKDTGRRQSRETDNIGYKRYGTKTIQRNWQHWVQKIRDEDNPEKLTTLGTKDTGRRQSRETDNIGYTGHRTKTIQRNWQHWVQKIRDEDKEINKHNTENQNDEHHGHHQTLGWTKFTKGNQFLSHITHLPCYSYSQGVFDVTIGKYHNFLYILCLLQKQTIRWKIYHTVRTVLKSNRKS